MASSKWLKRHSFDLNMDYTEKILRKFNIVKYHFGAGEYGHSALIIDHNLGSYRIEVDDIKEVMIVKKKMYKRMGQKHPKEYMEVIGTYSSDCIYDSIKTVVRNSII